MVSLKEKEFARRIKLYLKLMIKFLRELKNKTILITGGAGSVGLELTKKLLQYPVRQIRILDIDEHALFQLSHSLNDKRIRVLLGSILNKDRTEMACLLMLILYFILQL